MRKVFYSSIIFILMCCTESEKIDSFSFKAEEFIFFDTVRLDQNSILISDFYQAQLMNDSIIGFINVASNNLYCYTLNGDFLFDLSEDYFPIEVLPKMSIANFQVFEGLLYVAYWGNNCLYKFSLEGIFKGKTCLNYKQGYSMDSRAWMKIINKDSLVVESEATSWKQIKNKFSSSPLVSVFDLNSGKHLTDIGNYPDYFSEGNLALQSHILPVWNNGHLYSTTPVGSPSLQFWPTANENITWRIPFEKYDGQVSYFKSNPWDGDLLDQIITLSGSDNYSNYFYGTYRYYENNTRNEGETSYGLRFFKLDTDNKTFYEQEIEEDVAAIGSMVMVQSMVNDTVRFLKKEDEEVYLISCTTLK